MREGVADLARHPLNDPIPAGATDAGLELGPDWPKPIRETVGTG